MGDSGIARCGWAGNERLLYYHDTEWGVPQHEDRTLFEFLILEGAQAGLAELGHRPAEAGILQSGFRRL